MAYMEPLGDGKTDPWHIFTVLGWDLGNHAFVFGTWTVLSGGRLARPKSRIHWTEGNPKEPALRLTGEESSYPHFLRCERNPLGLCEGCHSTLIKIACQFRKFPTMTMHRLFFGGLTGEINFDV